MKKVFLLSLILSFTFSSFSQSNTISKIAFGSCAGQDATQEILYSVIKQEPDLFIYLGDNIYGDTQDMDVLKAKYEQLGAKEEFQALRASCEVIATWDDHDYGKNDGGKNYPMKKESKAVFLNFWNEPGNSQRYAHEGIYHSEYYGKGEQIVQVILLDTRTFRTRLKYAFLTKKYKNSYRPNFSKNATILGEAQWQWLEKELQVPATIRIIASSNQFGHEHNGYESWTNFPLEQEKFLKIVAKTQAQGVLFISGDVHWGELSKWENDFCYPIYDFTSSGLTKTWHSTEPNFNRVGEVVVENNFGLIEIDWSKELLTFNLFDKTEKLRVMHRVPFYELGF